jgi:hypothetical protein
MTMRKVLWGCAAVAVTAAGIGYVAVQYAWDHPASWLGRGLITADYLVASRFVAAQAPAEACEPPACCTETVPATPTHAPACEESSTCHTSLKADEEGCAVPIAVLPGGLVMCEEPDEAALPAVPMPPVRDAVGSLPWLGPVEDSADVLMPPVEADRPPMPRVEQYRHGRRQPVTGSETMTPDAMPRCDKPGN